MAKLKIHGGDFAKVAGWFYSPRAEFGGFVVRNKAGKAERIPIEDLTVAKPATAEAIRAHGGDESLVAELERLPAEDRTGAFVALFSDGRILLGTTDPETLAAICARRGTKMH